MTTTKRAIARAASRTLQAHSRSLLKARQTFAGYRTHTSSLVSRHQVSFAQANRNPLHRPTLCLERRKSDPRLGKGFHAQGTDMSDADYEAFLNKASEDSSGATTQSSKKVGTKAVDTEVPKALEQVEEYYTSDADEPFEPVALSYDGSSVSAGDLKKLLGHGNNVSEVSEKEFDGQGQYKKVVEAVKKAGNGKVGIFRVEHGGTRSEFFVVSVDEKGGKLVGLKALAVES
ncbi:hypothetical protein EJ04DRAFT_507506 [Polyplosphaeria fusca]|uniref:Uncharacterized protein n=1 Tax=Polyplosphaeria fusca TaxID=682080 RepID=A0A9P4RBM5_9PLEO|nr:hypothetical protein EJ04DRAFT_507506 [Polyplosphaeria fusca]